MKNVIEIKDEPVDADLCGWNGPGWYWCDGQFEDVNGPFATQREAELALELHQTQQTLDKVCRIALNMAGGVLKIDAAMDAVFEQFDATKDASK